MGVGYVRADTANNIDAGKNAQASDIDLEYNAVQSAFASETGHTHDGTTGEGGPITVVGPTQDITASATEFYPTTDGTVALGSDLNRWNGLYSSGDIDLEGNIIVTGNVDGRDVSVDGAALDQAEIDIDALDVRLSTAESDITAIEALNTTQNNRLTAVETKNTTQDSTLSSHGTRLTNVETKNTTQDSTLSSLQSQINALTNAIISKIYPIGSIYMTARNENPATTLGIGTWERYGEGRALVGYGTADGVFYNNGTQRGVNEVTLAWSQMPPHAHDNGTLAAASHDHASGSLAGNTGSSTFYQDPSEAGGGASTWKYNGGAALSVNITGRTSFSGTLDVTGTTANAGSGAAHTNIQPSIGVYVWRRIG